MPKASEMAARNAEALQLRSGSAGASAVAILLDPDSGYMAIAGALVRRRRRRFSWGHVLCESLNTTAKACDPATYSRILQLGLEQSLVGAGMKPWIARVLAASSMKVMLATAGDPSAQLRLTLRGLIVLACPNLARCPALNDVSKAFLAPYVADEIRAGAAALTAQT